MKCVAKAVYGQERSGKAKATYCGGVVLYGKAKAMCCVVLKGTGAAEYSIALFGNGMALIGGDRQRRSGVPQRKG